MNLRSPIASGNSAQIYLYNGKIVKVFRDHLPSTVAEYEANKQRIAYSLGLPVPQVLDLTRISGKQAIVMEYAQGTTLGDLMQQDAAQTESYLALSVDIQVEIHSKFINSLEPMKDKLTRQLKHVKLLDEPCRAKLLKLLDELPTGNRLCHGDYHVFNLIKTENRTVIIDWVDATAGNPHSDAYRSYLLYSQFSSHLADRYLRLYCDKSGFTRNDIFAWAPIVAGARLSENVSTEHIDFLVKIVHQYL